MREKKSLQSMVIVGLLAVTSSTSLWACNASHVLGAGGSGAVYTMSANTMEEGGFYVGVSAQRVKNDSLSNRQIEDAIEAGSEHLHSIDAMHSYAIAFSYGITDTLTFNMNLPYSTRKNIRAGEHDDHGGHSHAEVHSHGNSEGLGDLTAILQYKIYDVDKMKFALLAGIKAPTGKTDVADADEVLEADLQPGTGSWDYFAGLAFSKDFENFSFHSSVLYKYNTEGVNDSRLGDIFTYNAALSFRLIGEDHKHFAVTEEVHTDFEYTLDFFVEINGEVAQRDSYYGVDVENTGHHVIYLTTGVQLLTQDDYSAFIAFSTPAYQELNGLQNEIQYKVSIGVGKSF